jgi:hypothetical protein
MGDSRARRILHYQLTEELGRDRVGAVFGGMDEQLERPVVLKVVRAADLAAPEAVDTLRDVFRRSAQTAARVGHPNFATIYAFDSVGALDLIVMEQVEGDSLLDLVGKGRRWAASEAARLIARIADTVAAAHERGIAHGHLSLANVKLRPDGHMKVLDLGVPKASAVPGAAKTPVLPPANAESYRADVAALAAMTCRLIAGALPADAEAASSERIANTDYALADPAKVWRNFGVLAPALSRGLGLQGEPWPNVAAFRDALLEPLHSRRFAAPDPEAQPEIEEELGRLTAPGARGPALALPVDLAKRAAAQTQSVPYVPIMPEGRIRAARRVAAERLRSVPRGALVAAAIGTILVAGSLIGARIFISSGGANAASVGAGAPPAGESYPPISRDSDPVAIADSTPQDTTTVAFQDPPPLPVTSPETVSTTAREPARTQADPPARTVTNPPAATDAARTREPAARSALVTAGPAGARIEVASQPGQSWSNRAELTVSGTDSLVVSISRNGYVTERRVFRGSPIDVRLRPDSVTAVFAANVDAVVMIAEGAGWRTLGTTDFDARLPTGNHRFVFRSPEQEEWIRELDMSRPGERYRVQKLDFPTRGDIVVTIARSWANVSLNGGEPRQTPAVFENLPLGRQIILVARPGYETIIDTVLVRPGQKTTRSYTLIPR